MSKLNQIQNALKEIEGGAFQKLCDAYLNAKGLGAINSLGSMIGKDKTRIGTPDTFIRSENGELIFVEYTTITTGVLDKFLDDLIKCLDEAKTGVPLSDISKIIFVHNSKLNVDEENSLVEMARASNVCASVYGLEAISFDLYQKFPGIAKDCLGVEIDTGQILPPQAFVEDYGKSKLVTPLSTEFLYHEEKLGNALEYLENNDLLIVTGAAGVGKSRLSLKIIEQYQVTHPDCQPFCITNKGQDLFEDIKVYFSQSNHFIILVDDANRTTGFEYIIDLLKTKREDQNIKVIATVRDYALDKIKDQAGVLGVVPELKIKPLETSEIKSLVTKLFPISNEMWLERISSLSAGNPRLAIMAATYAIEKEDLSSINDVTALYDHYFSSLRQEILNSGQQNLIAVAGIISFFRTIDKSNNQLMQSINQTFGIDETGFWAACVSLHEFELVDIYENEVVKISDQVVSTYFFYLCFFKEKKMPFFHIIDSYFPRYSQRVGDALYPCLNSFDSNDIISEIETGIRERLKVSIEGGDDELTKAFFKTFWFILQIDILQYINKEIQSLDKKDIDFYSIVWKAPNTNVAQNPLFELIKSFKNTNLRDYKLAIELAFDLIERDPSSIPDMIYMLTKDFGFNRHSHHDDYKRQTILLDLIIARTEMGANELYSRVFLAASTYFLQTEFDETVGGDHTITIHQFQLTTTDTIKEFRRKIWQVIFALIKVQTLRKPALDALLKYADGGYSRRVTELQQFDAEMIFPLLQSNFDFTDFSSSYVCDKVIKRLSHLDVKPCDKLVDSCDSEIMSLYRVLKFSYTDMDSDEYDKFDEIQLSNIAEFSKNYNLQDYEVLIEKYLGIIEVVGQNKSFHINSGLEVFFTALAERDKELFVEVIAMLLRQSGEFENKVRPHTILRNLFEFCSPIEVQGIIKGDNTNNRYLWKTVYHEVIPDTKCTKNDVIAIYALLNDENCNHAVFRWDAFQKYINIDERFIQNSIKIINTRVKQGTLLGDPYGLLFNSLTAVCKDLSEIFGQDLDTLKEAYLLHDKLMNNPDLNGFVMSQILDKDPLFLCDYILSITENKKYFSHFDNKLTYDFLWSKIDVNEIIDPAITLLEKLKYEKEIHCDGIVVGLFSADKHVDTKEIVIAAQDNYLEASIARHFQNHNRIEILFTAISHFEAERRLKFIERLLNVNQDFVLFQRLSLEPNHYSCLGSAVGMYSKRRDFWNSIEQLCNSIALLEHRKKCDEIVQGYNRTIEEEKKRDFVGI